MDVRGSAPAGIPVARLTMPGHFHIRGINRKSSQGILQFVLAAHVILESHLGELPDFAPFDVAFFAAH